MAMPSGFSPPNWLTNDLRAAPEGMMSYTNGGKPLLSK